MYEKYLQNKQQLSQKSKYTTNISKMYLGRQGFLQKKTIVSNIKKICKILIRYIKFADFMIIYYISNQNI